MDKSALAYINEYPALPEIAKRAQVSGELHIAGIGKLRVRVKALSGKGVRLLCEPLG
jgi:hypothetical protein